MADVLARLGRIKGYFDVNYEPGYASRIANLSPRHPSSRSGTTVQDIALRRLEPSRS